MRPAASLLWTCGADGAMLAAGSTVAEAHSK
jgi:hypothetical protein